MHFCPARFLRVKEHRSSQWKGRLPEMLRNFRRPERDRVFSTNASIRFRKMPEMSFCISFSTAKNLAMRFCTARSFLWAEKPFRGACSGKDFPLDAVASGRAGGPAALRQLPMYHFDEFFPFIGKSPCQSARAFRAKRKPFSPGSRNGMLRAKSGKPAAAICLARQRLFFFRNNPSIHRARTSLFRRLCIHRPASFHIPNSRSAVADTF